jgi:hypothetical protein
LRPLHPVCMGSLNQSAMATANLLPTAVMVVVGSLLATIATDVARENIYDVDMEGGDALYPVAVVFAINAVGGGYTVKMVSIGMMSSAVTTIARQWGLV